MANNDMPTLARMVWATRNSLRGLRLVWQHEKAFRIECWIGLAIFPLGLWLARSPVELALLFGSCLIVLAAELGNSAIEATIDRFSTDQHELAGRAKDMGSAMVMLTMINVLLVWGLVALGRLAG